MIPKILHYCWFGGQPLPEDIKRYLQSWKKQCPDYKIMRWDETNFDVTSNKFCQQAYENRKWAFVSDYFRLKILYDYGGIYMDTDVEVLQKLDDFLHCKWFSGFEKSESGYNIPTGTMGSEKGSPLIKELLEYYEDNDFIGTDGCFNTTSNVVIITDYIKQKYNVIMDGQYKLFGDGFALYPFDYFCAKSFVTGKLYLTSNTYTVHHFKGSWLTPRQKRKILIKKILIKVLGENNFKKLLNIRKNL